MLLVTVLALLHCQVISGTSVFPQHSPRRRRVLNPLPPEWHSSRIILCFSVSWKMSGEIWWNMHWNTSCRYSKDWHNHWNIMGRWQHTSKYIKMSHTIDILLHPGCWFQFIAPMLWDLCFYLRRDSQLDFGDSSGSHDTITLLQLLSSVS